MLNTAEIDDINWENNLSEPVGGKRKRCLDLTFAILLVMFIAPLLILLAIGIFAADGRPLVFKHKRIGFRGRPFDCYKFRSMVANGDAVLLAHLETDKAAAEEWSQTRKLRKDPRVTLIGRILRASSLDELPQLINVIKGEMSLVGPRPIVESEIERFGDNFERYKLARPGITGLWQVNGRSDCTYAQRVLHDSCYVENWSLFGDLAILTMTARVVLSGRGSY